MDGFVKIARSLTNNWMYSEKPFDKTHAWLDLILLASFKDTKRMYKGELQEVKRGEIHASIKWLAERWGWSWRKTKTFLSVLESDQMCTLKCTTNDTTITLENYGLYQDWGRTNGTTNVTTRVTTSAQRVQTLEESKESKEGKEDDVYKYTSSAVQDADADVHTDKVVTLWNSTATSYRSVRKVNASRKEKILDILRDFSYEDVEQCFRNANESDFLRSRNFTSFDWVLDNFVKILEGNYENQTRETRAKANDTIKKLTERRNRLEAQLSDSSKTAFELEDIKAQIKLIEKQIERNKI